MVDLSVEFLGIRFKNPFLLASVPTTTVAGFQRAAEEGWAGGIIWGGELHCSPSFARGYIPREFKCIGKPPQWWAFQNTMCYRDPYEQPGQGASDEDLETRVRKAKESGIPVGCTIGLGSDPTAWAMSALAAERGGADFLELNMSCPWMPGVGLSVGAQLDIMRGIIEGIRRTSSLPIMVKLNAGEIREILAESAKTAVKAGADAISITNTLSGVIGVDIETGMPLACELDVNGKLRGIVTGISGPAIKPIGLRGVAEVRRVVDVPISGIGGITEWESAVEYMLLGASTVQIGTAGMLYGYKMIKGLVKGLTGYMEKKGYKSLEDFVGMTSEKYIVGDPWTHPIVKQPRKMIIDEAKCLGCGWNYPPCRAACPAGVDAACIAHISQSEFKEALEVVRQAMPFAGVCGRVCTHPCETDCERGKVDEPVAIRSLKRFIADYELRAGRKKAIPVEKTKEDKVAIIGSGPTGLACAYDLVREGYPVTVFEVASQAGGMLRYGIPEYRLPKAILDNEISFVEELGVEIKTDKPVKNLGNIFSQGYKAVFIATGAGVSQQMDIPNEETKGVIHALAFLKQVNSGEKVDLGNKVAVIGGGNAAIDAARAVLRLGTREVSIVYRRSRGEMPAIKSEVDQAEQEGAKIKFLATPVRVLAKANRVSGIQCIRMELGKPDTSGRRSPIPIKGSEFQLDVDSLIIAIGQVADKSMLPKQLEYTDGALSVDPVTMQTNIEGVFAGGDVVLVADIIKAIAAGKEAAISIRRYLEGMDLKEGRPDLVKRVKDVSKQNVKTKARRAMPLLELERRDGFAEVELGFDENKAIEEAERCLSCGAYPVCVIACEASSSGAEAISVVDGLAKIDHDDCHTCNACRIACPEEAISVEWEPAYLK